MSATCPQCGQAFSCGAQGDHCWCADLPAILPPDPTRSCLCRDCLAPIIGKQIEQRLNELPFDEALELARSSPRTRQLIEHIDYTMNDQQQLVLSRWYLLKRGKCCGERCSQCPYPDSGG